MFTTRAPMKNIDNNEIYSFYHNKYYGMADDEIYYLSGIGYIYRCLDELVENANFHNLCIEDDKLCTKCCQKQEAHVSMAEMQFFLENHRDFMYNSFDKILEHAKSDPQKCEDLFFNNGCIIYPDRFFVCRAYMNLFNGEPYCPRHNSEILKGQAVDDIVDCFYYFIDRLTEIDSRKYKGSITPTYFFIQHKLRMDSMGDKEGVKEFFRNNSLNIDWMATYKPYRYSIGLLGSANYSEEYIQCVQDTSGMLMEV